MLFLQSFGRNGRVNGNGNRSGSTNAGYGQRNFNPAYGQGVNPAYGQGNDQGNFNPAYGQGINPAYGQGNFNNGNDQGNFNTGNGEGNRNDEGDYQAINKPSTIVSPFFIKIFLFFFSFINLFFFLA